MKIIYFIQFVVASALFYMAWVNLRNARQGKIQLDSLTSFINFIFVLIMPILAIVALFNLIFGLHLEIY